MHSVNPKYIIALLLVVVLAGALKVMNPHKQYSTREFWQQATIESVTQVPDEALKTGNRNGSVLMWAAMGSSDPGIITALVERGADINEEDPLFSGTPLTGAAGYNNNPEIIRELVRLGSDIEARVNLGNTALMIAAMYNQNPGIIEELLAQGADINSKNVLGQTALDLAKAFDNPIAVYALSGPRDAGS